MGCLMFYYYKIGFKFTGIFLIFVFIYSLIKFWIYTKQIKGLRAKLLLINCDLKDSAEGLIFIENLDYKLFKTVLPSLDKINPFNDLMKHFFPLLVILSLSWLGFIYLLLAWLLKVYELIQDYGYEGRYNLNKIISLDIDTQYFYLNLLNIFEDNQLAKRRINKIDNVYDLLVHIPEFKKVEEDGS